MLVRRREYRKRFSSRFAERLHRQNVDSRGCQLNRQRYAVQSSAEFGNDGSTFVGQREAMVNREGAIDKERDRSVCDGALSPDSLRSVA